MFIKVRYLPCVLIQSVIIPLVKCKSGNLSDVNNYGPRAIVSSWIRDESRSRSRAIAISTAKLFKSVIASHVFFHHLK